MAAPAEMTTADISGVFIMNKNLSDSSDKILELQGVGWLTRKAISLSTVTLYINHFKDDVERINIKQTISGIEGTEENRTLDWTEREHKDKLFGDVISKSRRVKVEEVEHDFLKNGWIPEAIESGVLHSYVVSDTAKNDREWTAEQIWGFEIINGEKRYVRHIRFTSGSTLIEAKLIYDYVGPLQK